MSILDRVPRLPVPRMFLPARPPLAAELDDGRLAVVRTGGGRGDLAAFHVEDLPAGLVAPTTAQAGLQDEPALRAAIARARQAVAPSGGPLALALPDPLFRISVMSLDTLPRGFEAVREAVAWRLKKTLPYRIEDASLSWQVLAQQGERATLLAVAARRRVIQDLEAPFVAEGFRVGCVVPATLVLCDALSATAGTSLVIHATGAWFSMAVSSGGRLALFRCKTLPASDASIEARDAALAIEVPPTIEYHATRLGGGPVARCVLHATEGADALAARLQDVLALPVEMPAPGGLPAALGASLGVARALALRSEWARDGASAA